MAGGDWRGVDGEVGKGTAWQARRVGDWSVAESL